MGEGTSKEEYQNTRLAYITTRVLDTPFWALYNMLPVIFYKDLHFTPFQLALLIALKPVMSLFSSYWSSPIKERPDRLVSNIMWARLLGYFPFFFFPWIDTSAFFIAAYGLYMMMAVGSLPAWMELLKLNIPEISREKIFSYTQAFGYMGGGLLPFLLGWTLDEYEQAWRWLLPLASILGLLPLFFQRKVPLSKEPPSLKPDLLPMNKSDSNSKPFHHVGHELQKPWKNAFELLKENGDFRRFQWGFMIFGIALMIVQPALPLFFVDSLHLSYTELAIALTLCKGFGFAASSPFWSFWMNRIDIFRLGALGALLGSLFPLCLLLASWHVGFVYAAYLIYGVIQSGSELIWNLSGPSFAKDKDSTVFSSVNIIAVGIRGCFVPALGSALCLLFGAPLLLLTSGAIYLVATARLWRSTRSFRPQRT